MGDWGGLHLLYQEAKVDNPRSDGEVVTSNCDGEEEDSLEQTKAELEQKLLDVQERLVARDFERSEKEVLRKEVMRALQQFEHPGFNKELFVQFLIREGASLSVLSHFKEEAFVLLLRRFKPSLPMIPLVDASQHLMGIQATPK